MKRALFILILAAAVMGGCITDSDDDGGDKPGIVGIWKTTSGSRATFRADGSFASDAWDYGNYTVKGDSLIMVRPNQEKTTFRMTFILTGDFLTIKDWRTPPDYYDYIRVKQ